MVSIIVRTKNEERWITSCLTAVFKQHNKDFEVIIVDNESTDKTIEKALQFDIAKIAEDDWRRKNPFFAEPQLSNILKFVERLKPIAARQNKTVGHLAIAWVLKNTAITSAIVGARRKEQVLENINAAEYVLSDDEMKEIQNLITEFAL